jgi:N-sulfoglucosamine sulfohydrolase
MAPTPDPLPNVLLVVAEDMGPQLGTYGCTEARTPHLDRFAQRGARFESAWCSYPLCSPARSTLLTGLPPHENGTMGLSTFGFATFEGVPSLSRLLNYERGYRTGLLGKHHVVPEERFPFHLRWADNQCYSFAGRDYRRMLRFADTFMDDASSPFFLMVALPDAHLPFLRQSFGEPRQPMNAADVGIVPGMDRRIPSWEQWYADYHNCIQRADLALGGLMDILDRRGLRDNTLVIFTSDHGLQFPRGKLSLYEPGMSIPMLMAGPGVTPRPEGVRTAVSQVDVFATILDATGIERPSPCRGESLMNIADNDPDRCVFGERTACMPQTYFPQRAVRDGRFKLIWTHQADRMDPYHQMLSEQFSSPGETAPPSPPNSMSRPPIPPSEQLSPVMRKAYEVWRQPPAWQLYDLADDPLETINRAGDPQLAQQERRLRGRLEQWMRDTDDFVLDHDRRTRFETEIQAYVGTGGSLKRPGFHWDYVSNSSPCTLNRRPSAASAPT